MRNAPLARPGAGLLDALGGGATLAGMQCFSGSPVLVEAMGQGGLDFTIIDLEHCPTSLEAVAHCVRAADAAGIVPLVRVPDLDRPLIGRVLDVGARGIVLPHASPERCAAAVRACRYGPEGDRGACPVVRAAGYLPDDWSAHAARSNRETMLVPLVEDPEAVDILPAAHLHRYGERFKQEGVNVNFVRWRNGAVEMRTYERGVEAETLSCGTGVTAAALSAMRRAYVGGTCHVRTRGGDLHVGASTVAPGFQDITLAGPAVHVFNGEWEA